MDHGKLWVTDRLPPNGKCRIEVWQVTAEAGDDVFRLVTKWLDAITPNDIPHARNKRAEVFAELVRNTIDPLALVIEDAHLLNGRVMDGVRICCAEAAVIVLVGDPACIEVATQAYAGFYQRAAFCVHTSDIFSAERAT
jgi:hypothetical protein